MLIVYHAYKDTMRILRHSRALYKKLKVKKNNKKIFIINNSHLFTDTIIFTILNLFNPIKR